MIDTHAHIYLKEFDNDLSEVMERSIKLGVKKVLLPNVDIHSITPMLKVEENYPNLCHAMIGLHPCYVKEDYQQQLVIIENWLEKRAFIAVGEIGLDFYWDKTYKNQQFEAVYHQCELALKYDIPVVFHCRNAIDEMIEIISEFEEKNLRGVFHCFTGTEKQAQKITDKGFYLGIGGVITFKNSGLDKIVPFIDKTKIILETDSPYLSPAPHRGKRNEPSYLSLIAMKIGNILGMSLLEIDELSTHNANNLFWKKTA